MTYRSASFETSYLVSKAERSAREERDRYMRRANILGAAALGGGAAYGVGGAVVGHKAFQLARTTAPAKGAGKVTRAGLRLRRTPAKYALIGTGGALGVGGLAAGAAGTGAAGAGSLYYRHKARQIGD